MLGCGEECPSYRALHLRTSRAVKKATEKNDSQFLYITARVCRERDEFTLKLVVGAMVLVVGKVTSEFGACVGITAPPSLVVDNG